MKCNRETLLFTKSNEKKPKLYMYHTFYMEETLGVDLIKWNAGIAGNVKTVHD